MSADPQPQCTVYQTTNMQPDDGPSGVQYVRDSPPAFCTAPAEWVINGVYLMCTVHKERWLMNQPPHNIHSVARLEEAQP